MAINKNYELFFIAYILEGNQLKKGTNVIIEYTFKLIQTTELYSLNEALFRMLFR